MGEVIDLTCSQPEDAAEAAISVQPSLKKARTGAALSWAASASPALLRSPAEPAAAAAPAPASAEFGPGEDAAEDAMAGPSGGRQLRGALAESTAAPGGTKQSRPFAVPPRSNTGGPVISAGASGRSTELFGQLEGKLLLCKAQQQVLRVAFAEHRPQEIERHQLQRALRMCRGLPCSPPLEDPAGQRHFSVLTYNIWFDPTMGPERMAAIGRLIERDCHLPDFVLLQEVTHHYYLALAAQPFWRHYHASPMPPPTPLPGWGPDSPSPIFTVILWRRDRVAGGRYEPAHPFANSIMFRDLKSVACSIGGTRLRGEDAPSPLPPGWHDVWLALRPDEQGWTFDTNICPQKGRRYKNGARLDRMFCRLADWELLAVERVGMEPIPGLHPRIIRTGKTARSDKVVPTWPSDHFGLHALFVRRGALGTA